MLRLNPSTDYRDTILGKIKRQKAEKSKWIYLEKLEFVFIYSFLENRPYLVLFINIDLYNTPSTTSVCVL